MSEKTELTSRFAGRTASLSAYACGFAAAISLLSFTAAARADVYWQVQSGDWSTSANWSGGLPTSSGTADIVDGGTASVTTTGDICNTLLLGNTAGSGFVQMTSGALTVSNSTYVGYSGAGTFIQSGGTNTSAYLDLGYNFGASGTYSLNGGSLNANTTYVGYSGTGTFTQSGGINASGVALFLGYNSGSSGTYNLSGGSLSPNFTYVGDYGTGVFTQSGGTNAISNYLYLGVNSGGNGTYSLNGGFLSAPLRTLVTRRRVHSRNRAERMQLVANYTSASAGATGPTT